MDIQKERQAFEAWVGSNGRSIERFSDGSYKSMTLDKEWEAWQAAKAQAVPEGFVLISAEQLSQWGHMANYAEQYGCPECFEARGYAHSLACEINAYFNVSEAQEPANEL